MKKKYVKPAMSVFTISASRLLNVSSEDCRFRIGYGGIDNGDHNPN